MKDLCGEIIEGALIYFIPVYDIIAKTSFKSDIT